MTTGEPQLGYDLFFVVNLFPTVALMQVLVSISRVCFAGSGLCRAENPVHVV